MKAVLVGRFDPDALAELEALVQVVRVPEITAEGVRPHLTVTSPLLGHPKVLLTPHLGAWTADTDRRVCQAAVEVVRTWMARACEVLS